MEIKKVFLCSGVNEQGEWQDIVAGSEEELAEATDIKSYELATWYEAMYLIGVTGTTFTNHYIELEDGVYKWVYKCKFRVNTPWIDVESEEYKTLSEKYDMEEYEFHGYVPDHFKDTDYRKMQKYIHERQSAIYAAC